MKFKDACSLDEWVSEWSRSVMSDSLWPQGLYPTRLLCPWNFPGKSTGVGCHFLGWIAIDKLRQHIKKQRHYFVDKSPYSQSYGFSSSHVQIWEFEHNKGWVPKNWCFWTVVLEKTLESPLDIKEIRPVNHKRNHPWLFIESTDAEAPMLWPPDVKSQLIGKDPDVRKDWGQKEKGAAKDQTIR